MAVAQRFGIEGCEALLPGLRAMVKDSTRYGVEHIEVLTSFPCHILIKRSINLKLPLTGSFPSESKKLHCATGLTLSELGFLSNHHFDGQGFLSLT